MKKIIFLLINFMLCTHLAAQTAQCTKARMSLRQKKELFMAREAQLTAKESQQFFPLYFELHKRQNDLKRNAWKCMCNEHKHPLKESDYESMLNHLVESERLIHELDQLYLEKYKRFLSSEKIYKLMRADILFNRRLLKAHPNHRR